MRRPWPHTSVYRTLSLPQRTRPALGADLNCSEFRRMPRPVTPQFRSLAQGYQGEAAMAMEHTSNDAQSRERPER